MSVRTARKAVVLAAGLGTRLRPFTASVPKPLLEVWGEPMLSRVVAWLRSQGVEEITVNAHHLASQVEAWCAANGCRVSSEKEILGTGGVLNPLREWIGRDDFWLVNGDIVFEEPPHLVLDDSPDVIGVAAVTEEGPRTIELEPECNLVTCWHSPDPGWSGTWTYCGIALLKAEILDFVKPEGFSSIIEAYEKASMAGKFIEGVEGARFLWTDAGTVESYIDVNSDGEDNAFAEISQVKAALDAAKLGEGKVEFCGARGSDRAFFKVSADERAYVIVYDDATRKENARYASHAKWLAEQGIKVPRVLAELPDKKTIVLESAGDDDLLSRSKKRGEERLRDYVNVVEELARFNSLDFTALELEGRFDAGLYKWERELFKEHCLGGRFMMEMPEAVEKELEAAAQKLLDEPKALVHRDFQSTNVIWKGDSFKFIDFQGMREGAGVYDLASLLYDPYVDLREGERRALAALYAKKVGRAPDEIAAVLPFAAVERLVQALGAFGRLASIGKKEFSRHIPNALSNLLDAADDASLDAVGALAEDLIAAEQSFGVHHHHHHHHGGECACHGHHHNDGGCK